MPWYALYVQTGQEEVVRNQLYKRFDKNRIRCLIPKRKVPERSNGILLDNIRIMFPGYVLINVTMDFEMYYDLMNIPKIYRLLNFAHTKNYSKDFSRDDPALQEEYFKEIPEEEVQSILSLINQDEILDYSEVFVENSRCTIRSGPLKNMEAIIKKIDKHTKRAKIILNFVGKEIQIDVGLVLLYNNVIEP